MPAHFQVVGGVNIHRHRLDVGIALGAEQLEEGAHLGPGSYPDRPTAPACAPRPPPLWRSGGPSGSRTHPSPVAAHRPAPPVPGGVPATADRWPRPHANGRRGTPRSPHTAAPRCPAAGRRPSKPSVDAARAVPPNHRTLVERCELSKSACFFRMAFIVYRKCLRTFTAAQQHLRRFPRVSAGIAQNSLR